jgi:hypothetical protein
MQFGESVLNQWHCSTSGGVDPGMWHRQIRVIRQRGWEPNATMHLYWHDR